MADEVRCLGCPRAFGSERAAQQHRKSCPGMASLHERAASALRAQKNPRAEALVVNSSIVETDVAFGDTNAFDDIAPLPETNDPAVQQTDVPVYSVSGREQHQNRRIPARYKDLPPDPCRRRRNPRPEIQLPEVPQVEMIGGVRSRLVKTVPDQFGFYRIIRVYLRGSQPANLPAAPPIPLPDNLYEPYPNFTAFELMDWKEQHSSLTDAAMKHLQAIMNHPNFRLEDAVGFNYDRLNKLVKTTDIGPDENIDASWQQTTLTVPVPLGFTKDPALPAYIEISIDFYYRRLEEVLRSILSSKWETRNMVWVPYEQRAITASGKDMGVYWEAFHSKRMRDYYDDVQRYPGDDLERVVVGIMLSSDALAPTNFGTTKIWPLYLYLANMSIAERTGRNSQGIHHIAHIPELPSSLQSEVMKATGDQKPPPDVLTHTRRLAYQAVFKQILGGDFAKLYREGFVVTCGDGVVRRIYPRMFAYSADYQEKTTIAGVMPLSEHPCVHCLVPKKEICRLGKKKDFRIRRLRRRREDAETRMQRAKAAKLIFEERAKISSKRVRMELQSLSITGVENAFGSIGIDPYEMLTVDTLHEYPLGVVKAIFSYAVELLNSYTGDLVAKLDERMRHVPVFKDQIRKHNENISAMKQMTAGDYEDILQCALPIFEGLLPSEHDKRLLDMLYLLGLQYTLSKLHMHTDETASALKNTITRFGDAMRSFVKHTCLVHERELSIEEKSNLRRLPPGAVVRRVVMSTSFAGNTSKLHALGHYVYYILMFGATNSYSTEIGESEHKLSKANYKRTNKVNFVRQLTQIYQRLTNLRRVRATLAEADEERIAAAIQGARQRVRPGIAATIDLEADDPSADLQRRTALDPMDYLNHYGVGKDGTRIDLLDWLTEHADDPATRGFSSMLRDHLLTRLRGDPDQVNYSDTDRATVRIKGDIMIEHKRLQINYTTYDLRRELDSFNSTSNLTDVMMLSGDPGPSTTGSTPFWYARLLMVFSVHARLGVEGDWVRKDIAWVRWFSRDDSHRFGEKACRFERLVFTTEGDDGYVPFGLIDPQEIIRAAHLIPAFSLGRTDELLADSQLARVSKQSRLFKDDYAAYYVATFSDRDIFMLHHGGGIGHKNLGLAFDMHYDVDDTFATAGTDPREQSRACPLTELDALDGADDDDDDDDIIMVDCAQPDDDELEPCLAGATPATVSAAVDDAEDD